MVRQDLKGGQEVETVEVETVEVETAEPRGTPPEKKNVHLQLTLSFLLP